MIDTRADESELQRAIRAFARSLQLVELVCKVRLKEFALGMAHLAQRIDRIAGVLSAIRKLVFLRNNRLEKSATDTMAVGNAYR
jgi:hypothetical protein